MLAFLAALVLNPSGTARAELRQADASYGELYPYPKQSPASNLRDTLTAYRTIVDDHGPVPGAEAGIGNCLLLYGHYRAAAAAFQRAGASYKTRQKEASGSAEASEAITRQIKPFAVQQVLRMPGTDRWVALLNPSSPVGILPTGWDESDHPKLAEFRRIPGTNQFQPVGKSRDLGSFWSGYFSTLYLVRLTAHDPTWRLMLFRRGSADCEPFDVRIFSVNRSGLKTLKAFEIYQGAWVRGPSADHGLLVMAGPAWHVDWKDLYEWKGSGFRFANRRFPRYFKIDRVTFSAPQYIDWMTRGAELDVHGRFTEAKAAWRKALRAWRKGLLSGEEGAFRDSGPYGDAKDHLREIRRRLAWLAHRDYNHRLLYRPIADKYE